MDTTDIEALKAEEERHHKGRLLLIEQGLYTLRSTIAGELAYMSRSDNTDAVLYLSQAITILTRLEIDRGQFL